MSALPAPSAAAPTSAKIEATRKEAARARERLDGLAADLEERSEEYLAVEEQLAKTKRECAEAEAALEDAEIEVASAKSTFDERITAIYRKGALGVTSVLMGVADFSDLVSRIDLFQRVGRSDAALVDRLKTARETVSRNRTRLENRRQEQVILLRQARAKKVELERAMKAQKAFLAQVDYKLSRLIAEERAREERLARERAARAAAAAAAAAASGQGSDQRDFYPASLGDPHSAVVEIARKYVNVTPYVWGGTTPSGFDCSGLTQYCYAEVGISIPRTSRQQFRSGTFIPRNRLDLLQPGDLVFFGRNGDENRVHHVGIYAGGGTYIHAPQSGMKVSVSSLIARIESKRDYVGATRP